VLAQPRLLILDPQGDRVRVGRQQHALAEPAQGIEEFGRPIEVADLCAHLVFEGWNIEPQFIAPVIDAIPLERAPPGIEARLQRRQRRSQVQSARLAPQSRHRFEPEQVVEAQVEHRAVHVEAHGVDALPIGDGRHVRRSNHA
jgi:hypothetical protein